MEQDYPIDKVSWHTQKVGVLATFEQVRERFWVIVQFFQENQLTIRQLANQESDIGEEFSIQRSDLTDLGFELVKRAYDGWLGAVDEGMSPHKLDRFKRALAKLRKENPGSE